MKQGIHPDYQIANVHCSCGNTFQTRTTVSEMGPLLLARLMNLNEVQEGVLTIAFHVADKDGLLLLDLDDLQTMLLDVGERPDAGFPGEPAAAPDPGACLGLAP